MHAGVLMFFYNCMDATADTVACARDIHLLEQAA
jgi:hypothetical protein